MDADNQHHTNETLLTWLDGKWKKLKEILVSLTTGKNTEQFIQTAAQKLTAAYGRERCANKFESNS